MVSKNPEKPNGVLQKDLLIVPGRTESLENIYQGSLPIEVQKVYPWWLLLREVWRQFNTILVPH